MNNTLTDRQKQLQDRQAELVKMAEDNDKQVQKLLKDKEQIVANFNAVAGALELVADLLKSAPESCECKATSQ